MRQVIKSSWFWFYVAIALISTLDFIDHVTRDYDQFRNIWGSWLIFTICCTLAISLWIYSMNLLTIRLMKRENLLQQTLVIVIALLLHQYVSGPVFDLIIFGRSTLNFKFNPVTLIIALLIFYAIRLILFFLTRKTKASTS